MKKIYKKNINKLMLYVVLLGAAVPFVVSAQVSNTPFLGNKICLSKYQAEVSAVAKLIDTKKADIKILEIKTSRKEEDKTIKNIFIKIEDKITDKEKKDIIDEKKDIVIKTILERREKTDELQSNIRITRLDIETLVTATLLDRTDDDNPKLCPIQLNTAKEIRSKNIQKLKKLASDKKDLYKKQTKEIQDDFNADFKSALDDLNEEISK